MSTNSDEQEPPEATVGPAPEGDPEFHPYHHPAAGWGAAKSVSRFMVREGALVDGRRAIMRMNHENTGFDCPGCAWPDDTKGLHLDICENGIKHVTWEMTRKPVGREFFAAHSVTELSGWSDYDLENQGRLTEPMVYDPGTDHYVPISWKAAFEVVGRALRGLDDPNQASSYTSGRLGNEATFLYQLMARELGTNNLPNCSNMEHGPPVGRHEAPRLAAPAVRAGHRRRHGPRRPARQRDAVGVVHRGLRPHPRHHGPGPRRLRGLQPPGAPALGFRIRQPARELVFLTPSGPAEFSAAALPDVVPAPGTRALGTMRSHDQWNTTIYSDNDRYRGIKNLRTLVFMNRADMRERGIADLGPVDITSTARDGSKRSLNGYLAIPYDIPRGCAAGYMPEMNVLCAIGGYSTQSDQPIMKHVRVTIDPAS